MAHKPEKAAVVKRDLLPQSQRVWLLMLQSGGEVSLIGRSEIEQEVF